VTRFSTQIVLHKETWISIPQTGYLLTTKRKGAIYWRMPRLTGKDYRDVLNLVYLANRCQDIDSFINKLFPPLVELFNLECITFQLIRGYPWHIKVTESRAFKSDFRTISEDKIYPTLYKENYFHRSPLLKAAINSAKPILKIGDTISLQEWERSDMLNDFILPQNLYWELFLTLRWKSNLQGMITLWRSRKRQNYVDNDVSKAELLAPHLALALNNILSLSGVNNLKKSSLSNDETNNKGFLWLDNKLKPYFSNVRAREICLQLLKPKHGNEPGVDWTELSVPLSIIDDCSSLFDALKADEPVLLSKERVLSSENGRRFRIECSMVWKADHTGSVPSFLVTMSDLGENKKQLDVLAQTLYHLSRREMDVIYCLVRGMTEEEIAERLYISRLTVHTHVKNIYRKIGAKSRIELYRSMRLNSSMLR
jgi:DNA-binding CsgD family transcriptional regulator